MTSSPSNLQNQNFSSSQPSFSSTVGFVPTPEPESGPVQSQFHSSRVCCLQASGVTVNDEVIKVFNDMKVRKSSTQDEAKKRKKGVLFCLSDDRKKIIVEEGKQILVGDIGETVDDPYAAFVKLLPLNDCRYGLYDATYETKESKKEDLVFIFWYGIGSGPRGSEQPPLRRLHSYLAFKLKLVTRVTDPGSYSCSPACCGSSGPPRALH